MIDIVSHKKAQKAQMRKNAFVTYVPFVAKGLFLRIEVPADVHEFVATPDKHLCSTSC